MKLQTIATFGTILTAINAIYLLAFKPDVVLSVSNLILFLIFAYLIKRLPKTNQ